MRTTTRVLALAAIAAFAVHPPLSAQSVTCSATTGAPPIRTVTPVTRKPVCRAGTLLTWTQEGVERYACFNKPADAKRPRGRKWPLIVYLHGSLSMPSSLYHEGRRSSRCATPTGCRPSRTSAAS